MQALALSGSILPPNENKRLAKRVINKHGALGGLQCVYTCMTLKRIALASDFRLGAGETAISARFNWIHAM
jgi:hypothetical protein